MTPKAELTKLKNLAKSTSAYVARHPQRSALAIMLTVEYMGLSRRMFSVHASGLDRVIDGVIRDMMGEDYVKQA